jgi:hypothetical protein
MQNANRSNTTLLWVLSISTSYLDSCLKPPRDFAIEMLSSQTQPPRITIQLERLRQDWRDTNDPGVINQQFDLPD